MLALLMPEAHAEGRVALVVGNAGYAEAPLRNPINDARAMSALLRKLDFQVISVENASKSRLEQAILAFTGRLGPTTTGLFYYAGHGMQVGGRNYLIPVDANLASEREVRIETTPVHMVLEELRYAGNPINLVILDACRNNPFARRFRGSASRGLAAVDAARGTLIAYSTAPGSVALDGDGNNGLYTEELLRVLNSPGLKVEEVFKQVRRGVALRTANKQIPWESSSLIGDFVFNYKAPATGTTGGRSRADVVFWESIENSHNVDAYRAYLDQFPTGVFAALAKLRIEQLESAIVSSAPAVPQSRNEESLVALAPSTTTPAAPPRSLVQDQYQVALLPAQGKLWCSGAFDPSDMDLEMVRSLNARREFAAAYYPHGSWNSYGTRLGTKGALWEPDGLRRRPVADRAYEYGKRLGVDAVLVLWYEARGIDCDRVEVQAHLFDVDLEKNYLTDESRGYFFGLSADLLALLNEGRQAADARSP